MISSLIALAGAAVSASAIGFMLLWLVERRDARFWRERSEYWYNAWEWSVCVRPSTNPLRKKCIRVASIDELLERSRSVEEA